MYSSSIWKVYLYNNTIVKNATLSDTHGIVLLLELFFEAILR